MNYLSNIKTKLIESIYTFFKSFYFVYDVLIVAMRLFINACFDSSFDDIICFEKQCIKIWLFFSYCFAYYCYNSDFWLNYDWQDSMWNFVLSSTASLYRFSKAYSINRQLDRVPIPAQPLLGQNWLIRFYHSCPGTRT